MPLQRRLPKRGFTNIFKIVYQIVNIKDLQGFEGAHSRYTRTLATYGERSSLSVEAYQNFGRWRAVLSPNDTGGQV